MSKYKHLIDSLTNKTNFYYMNLEGEYKDQWQHYNIEPVFANTEEICIRIPNQSYKDEALLLLSLGMGKDEIEDQLGTGNENNMANSS